VASPVIGGEITLGLVQSQSKNSRNFNKTQNLLKKQPINFKNSSKNARRRYPGLKGLQSPSRKLPKQQQ